MTKLDIESFIDLPELSSLDTTELCDILWLAKYMKTDKRHYRTKEKVQESFNYDQIDKKDTTSQAEMEDPVSNEKQIETIEEYNDDSVVLSVSNKKQETNKAINISHKGYFDDSNQISKYLIDFKDKTSSKRKKLFDEITTINYKANTGILNPFFKAKKQKLYTLYLFIDYSSSMNVWKEMINEYTKLLSSGIFKSVKYVYVNSNNSKTLFYKDKKLNTLFSPKEITNFHNDKLIFVLTDMLSNGWKNGDALNIVAKLYKSIPVYIVQMLPYRLWRTTALKKASITTFNSIQYYPIGDSYNSEIDHLLKSLNTEKQKILKLPIVSFDLAYLKVIGKTLKANEDNKIDGAIFNLENTQNDVFIAETKVLTGQEKVEYFFANASPKAQELAKCLSAVQFNLPIMRMIQEKVLKESSNIYIAEVINSGLVNNHDNILEFNDDVCDVLYKLLGRERALEIAYKNSDYIQENLGANFGFKAYLSGQVSLENTELSETDKKFATISCRILKSMGGEYEKFAEKLQQRHIYFGDEYRDYSELNYLPSKKIRLVGVGGTGHNVIKLMLEEGLSNDVDLILANTDAQVLEQCSAAIKIQLGVKLTKGLGAGMKPEVGKESALESYEDLRRVLEGADIVFVAAGLGGGTGTGAAPIIAKIAKEMGALTIAVVTMPFSFEGKKRRNLAEGGLNKLKNESDCTLVVPNDKLLSIIDPKLAIKESFKIVDGILARPVSAICGTLISSEENDISLDLTNLKTIMSNRGLAIMGVGEYKGENAALEAIQSAFNSPFSDNIAIHSAQAILVHFNMHPKYPFNEISSAMDFVKKSGDESTEVVLSITTDANLSHDNIRVTLIATGFKYRIKLEEVEKAVIQKLHNSGWDDNTIIFNNNDHDDGSVDIFLNYMNKKIAAIELKFHDVDLDVALQVAQYSANKLNVPFAFATNGKTIYEYNLVTSEKNIIDFFPSPDSLQLRISENLITKEDVTTNDTTSEISFECEECGLKHFTTCSELDWDEVGGSERNMGVETEYEAEYTETCAQCGNNMNITFRCWEYPAGAENYRDVTVNGVVNLQGNCCVEFTTPDEEPTEDDPYSNLRREAEINRMEKDWLESIVDKNTSYSSLEEKIDELTTFIDNLTPYAELEFSYDAEDYSNEDDVPEDQFLISREFDQKYLHALIEEIQEDIEEITSYLHYNREEISIRNNLLGKKQYLIESDKIYESYGVDIECNIYPEDNEQILYIYPINNMLSQIDLLELDKEQDHDLSEVESKMMEWFFQNYDDPANFLPYETKEGGYQYLFGGPYELDQILYDEFGDIYPNSNIENVIKNIEQEYGDMTWAKKPNDEMYDYGDSENMNVSEQIEKEEEIDKTYIAFIPANGKIYKFEVSTQYYLIDIYKIDENIVSEFPALHEMIKKTNATDQGTINFKRNVEGNIPDLNKLILDSHSIYGAEKGISFYSLHDINKYIDPLTQKLNKSAIHAQINGNFSGWDGKSVIKLTNGEIWMQTEYYYQYSFAFMPKVTLISTPAGYRMKVDGINKEVAVKRLENTIESSIAGSFNGWNGDTVVELINGEKWVQSAYKYSYSYAYNPTVLIYNDGMGFKMKVEGNNEIVDVKRIV